jgi:hypothetical protein
MTLKQRRLVYELIAIGLSGFGLAFAIPTLVSAHDSVALLAALLLVVAWIGWVLYYGYRVLDYKEKF